MARPKIVTIFCMILFLQSVSGQGVDEIFRDFMRQTIPSFPSWAGQNNLDPTPPDSTTPDILLNITNTLYTMVGSMGNISVAGFSQELHGYTDYSSFLSGQIDTSMHMSCANLTGNYNLTGVVLNTYPISGAGIWNLEGCSTEIVLYMRFTVENGFIVLGDNVNFRPEFYMREHSGKFEGLFTGESAPYENLVISSMVAEISEFVKDQDKRIFTPYIRQYLNHVFETTPVSEILLPVTTPGTTTRQTIKPQ